MITSSVIIQSSPYSAETASPKIAPDLVNGVACVWRHTCFARHQGSRGSAGYDSVENVREAISIACLVEGTLSYSNWTGQRRGGLRELHEQLGPLSTNSRQSHFAYASLRSTLPEQRAFRVAPVHHTEDPPLAPSSSLTNCQCCPRNRQTEASSEESNVSLSEPTIKFAQTNELHYFQELRPIVGCRRPAWPPVISNLHRLGA